MRRILLACLMAGACTPQLQADQGGAAPLAEAPRPAFSKLFEDVRILSDDAMQGRLAGAPSGAMARAYLLRRFEEVGLQPVQRSGYAFPFPLKRDGETLEGVNLVGEVKGRSGSDRALLVMAHYDHVGVRDGQIYNGADDNASGVASLLAIAASLRETPPLHDVVIVAVDGEEEGIQGARALVADPRLQGLIGRIVLAVNFDMLSRSDRNELYVSGAWHFPWLKPRLDALAARVPVKLIQGHDDPALGHEDWTGQSDHLAFHKIDRPWVYFGVEDHPDYHQPTDDFDRIPQDFFMRSATTVEMAVRAFDRDLAAIGREAREQANAKTPG